MGKQKTVYVLGAGFSAAANFPLQNQLLSEIKSGLALGFNKVHSDDVLVDNQEKIKSFCHTVFPSSEEDQPMEDVFTILDQVIASRGHFAKYSTPELIEIRDAFIYCILRFLFNQSEQYLKKNDTLYRRFASHILRERISAGQVGDPLSIVSLNWDSLFEDAFVEVLKSVDGQRKGDIDYCVYTTPLPESLHCPSTKQKAAGLFNVKLLKLHGSVTWLRCPNSNHIYTGIGSSKDAFNTYLRERKSPFIADNYPDSRENQSFPLLEPYLITPTYAKVFDQPHIQTTWHNAYVELREASKVVFIGYSLPESDYHFRTLLRRAIRTETDIELVLYENDRPKKPEYDSTDIAQEPPPSTTLNRYQKLFGRERVKPPKHARFDGVKAYVNEMLPEDQFKGLLAEIKTKLKKHEIFNPFICLP